ncbi:MAG TPA: hypothetical protein VGS22_29020 [Thermoanaerobaculia bacterium]|jgi:hypothetical protein|nr:hypothetical protein [Thermoanaerobaculia bacterium]
MKRSLAHLFLFLLLPSTVAADWLAFKDGVTTETKGSWRIKGQRVIFTSMSGTLTAARLDEIDLPASEQLSKNAASDRKLIEIKSSPTEAYDWRTLASGTRVTPTGDGRAIVTEWSVQLGKHVGRHPALSCIPSRLVGVSSGTEWWLQTGTKIAKFRPLGLAWADIDQLKALVPDGLLCFEVDGRVKSPDPAGHLVGYARLADGRDIGIELLRKRAARLNDEEFSQRKAYLAVAQ